nr:unnamed protein product [Callosobruchus analis]
MSKFISAPLACIINICLKTGTVPSQSKTSVAKPIFKKGNNLDTIELRYAPYAKAEHVMQTDIAYFPLLDIKAEYESQVKAKTMDKAIRKRASVKSILTVFSKFVESLQEKDEVSSSNLRELDRRLNRSQNLIEAFNEVQTEIESLCEDFQMRFLQHPASEGVVSSASNRGVYVQCSVSVFWCALNKNRQHRKKGTK